MKRNFLKLVFIGSFFLVTSVFAAEKKYQLDPTHTFVTWHVDHLGFSTQTGKWPATGTLVLDQEHPQKSKVDVIIKIASMITGNPELNKHLKGSLFFNSKKFPTATFISNKIVIKGRNIAIAEGILTLHGVSKPILLHITLNKIGKNPVNDKTSVGFSARTEINRSDFDIKGLIPAVGDKVKLDIQAEAQLENEKTPQ